jgi:transposase
MEILEALDATGCAHSAAVLAGCDPKTVRHYGAARDAGTPVTGSGRRPRLVDEYVEKIEEWVDRSEGLIRADRIHERLVAMGFSGTERTTRRAVGEAKARWRAGHRRTYRPWITEPGLWLQFDWGDGPVVPGVSGRPHKTVLFCVWLAWSRFRVVLPCWDRTLPTLMACLDATLRAVGGVPSFLLTDNEKTVTVEHVAGVPVRHPDIVAAGRHYGCTVHTCVPYDPESKGGAESTVKIAKADLVPTELNLREDYVSFTELRKECALFCERVNNRIHRATAATPVARLAIEVTRLHRMPGAPHTLVLGETRKVATDQTVTFGSVRYSTPPGLVAQQVWVRADGEDLVVVADLGRLPLLPELGGRALGVDRGRAAPLVHPWAPPHRSGSLPRPPARPRRHPTTTRASPRHPR